MLCVCIYGCRGNYIDYKYFDYHNITPRYEFGYGLSYTTFSYADTVRVSGNATALASAYATGAVTVGGRADLWDVVATVSSSLSNNGTLVGAEVAQLYVTFPDAAGEPVRQLRGFQKVMVQPGATVDLSFSLRRKDISVWDVPTQNWKIESGTYTFYIAASSRDLKASGVLVV